MLKKFYKLFYLIGMAIPLIALLPCIFYFAFNEKASDYTETEVIQITQYETNEVNSIDDLIVGNIYLLKLGVSPTMQTKFYTNYVKGNRYAYLEINLLYLTNYDSNNRLIISKSSSTYNVQVTNEGVNTNSYSFLNGNLYFVYYGIDNQNDDFLNYIYASDYLGEVAYEVIESDFNPSNVLYNSFDLTSEYLEKGVFKINGKPIFSGWFSDLLGTNLGADMSGYSAINYLLLYLDYALMFNIIFIGFRSLTWLTDMVIKCFDRGFN